MTHQEQIDAFDTQIAAIKRESKKIRSKITPLEKQLVALGKQLETLLNDKDKLILESGKFDWTWLLEAIPDTDSKNTARRIAIRKLYLCDPFGHWADTGQSVIQIALIRNDVGGNQKQLDGVKTLLPFIKPNKAEGSKRIGIIENTLSLFKSYYLNVYEDGHCEVDGYTFPSIEAAFDYISENLWYESMRPSDDEEY